MKQIKNNNIQPTNQDILDAVNRMDKRMGGIEENNSLILQSINEFSTETDKRFNELEAGQEEIKFSLANKVNNFDFEKLKKDLQII